MAPDTETVRQRRSGLISAGIVHSNPNSETIERIVTLKGLANNEICIDGIIFDISSFEHPGGDSIKLFGGNDVTNQYKMIHPYHTAKHLEKMRLVGKIPDYAPEYKWDTPFEREIKDEVFKIVRRGREFGTPGYFFRAVLYLAIFFYLQYSWMQKSSYSLAIVYGISMGLVGLNVQHDANHGAASKKIWVNDLLGLGADLIGGSKWLWMEKHWTHHAYTNHRDKDPDGLAAEPFIILNDYDLSNPKRAGYHAYQAFYIVILLCGYWLSAILDVPMIWNLKDRGTLDVGVRLESDWIASRRKYALSLRIFYLLCNIFTPLYNDFCLTTLSHINVMGISGSLTLGLLFTLSHNFENADRDPTKENRETGEPVCWFKAQVETSSTYGGLISGWLTGGLNFQVEHHLFPRMSSAWYPYIAPKVREICEKHGVRYAYYPWIWQNMLSTLKYTHEVGTGSHW
eukprot:CAMPEP_0197179426 /NCGR_PEP_ID=MMETSP1423-20130617/4380_1 /TAXON_ID=476441 /ORGANISM="Pseudo-nitzschia heimii, Strain UNC1101" /LENGTH=455 /DNA_ID=CAMNT_0042629337 /DNA_START=24 /DNA_END=1388 /DNA_ORIENTATION=-